MVIGSPHASPRAAQLTARHSDRPSICVQVLIVEGLIICIVLFLVLVAIDPQLDGLLSFTLPGFLALEVQLQR
jgi:hypothetical protein